MPNGSLGHRFGDAGVGTWNLDLGDVDPLLTLLDAGRARPCSSSCRASTTSTAPPGSLLRDVPVRRVGGHLVTTVFDLMLAQYGVGRDGLLGGYATSYDDAGAPYTPAWQEAITGVPAAAARPDRARVRAERRGVPGPLDDPDGRRHQPLVPLRHDLPRLPRR